MEGRKDGRTEGRKAENYVPPLFFEKAGDKKSKSFYKVTYFSKYYQVAKYYS